jgi:hypothetical protein
LVRLYMGCPFKPAWRQHDGSADAHIGAAAADVPAMAASMSSVSHWVLLPRGNAVALMTWPLWQ